MIHKRVAKLSLFLNVAYEEKESEAKDLTYKIIIFNCKT